MTDRANRPCPHCGVPAPVRYPTKHACYSCERILYDLSVLPSDLAASLLHKAHPITYDDALRDLGEELRTQDNRITSSPIFLVQQSNRIYGFDSDHVDDPISDAACFDWSGSLLDSRVDEGGNLFAIDDDGADLPRAEYRVLYFRDSWQTVHSFFSAAAARDYIQSNAYKLTDPRVYVASGEHNPEWKLLRKLLMSLSPPKDSGKKQERHHERI